MENRYRGRVAPTPTGHMHLGHAKTFLVAQSRAREKAGALVMRVEDLDRARCKAEFDSQLLMDLRWAGIDWDEGPDVGGAFGPYRQSQRIAYYQKIIRELWDLGCLFPCDCSRRDVLEAIAAPHGESSDPIYPGTCRDREIDFDGNPAVWTMNWRFRVSEGIPIEFVDNSCGPQRFVAGEDFGDFLVWRKDGVPSYELAVVADDHAMGITEVVRGEDLLASTSRQLALYAALGWEAPDFYHAPLVLDSQGRRLAKRDKALGLSVLRERGVPAERIASDTAASLLRR